MKSKGFITVATGKYYCYLAENLARSYRLFSKTKYPLGVITDKESEKRLKKSKLFDEIIVIETPHYNYLDKILVYDNTPFDETVFIDADSDIVNDITYLMDDFVAEESDISCIGYIRYLKDGWKPGHFTEKTVERFNFDKFFGFNGGIYFFRKSEKAKACIDYILNDLCPNYDEYGLKRLFNKKTDEALMDVGMLVFDMKPLETGKDIMKLVQNTKNVKWDINKKECSFVWYNNEIVHPSILHWMTSFTKCIKYININAKVEGRYNKSCCITIILKIIFRDIKFFFNYKVVNFLKWVFSHFKVEHIKYKISQIKKIFIKK